LGRFKNKPENVALEYAALSELTRKWATSRAVPNRAKKLDLFSKAVFHGFKGNKKEGVPHEIVASDYRAIQQYVAWVRDERPRDCKIEPLVEWLIDTRVPINTSRDAPRRTVPLPKNLVRSLATKIRHPYMKVEATAAHVVAWRLEIDHKTVSFQSKKDMRIKSTPEQDLLVSLFFDCVAGCDWNSCGRILDTLHASGYHPIGSYYMLRAIRTMAQSSFAVLPDADAISRCCYRVSRIRKPGPFSVILNSSAMRLTDLMSP
jgi:hypothetical protein